MLTQEMVVTIQVLKKRGQSIKAISRETGISRNTVKKYLNEKSTAPQYHRRANRVSKLDPYKPYIHQRIQSASPAVFVKQVVRFLMLLILHFSLNRYSPSMGLTRPL
ncbi:helix-turn-helix domain-containing protein [Oligella urethralis]|uniref:Transposase and inactivated derivatives n=1 Tax=Oligella urethralis TaxID=90245 RepID=A0A2X1UNU5_9BURK|nr:helix-turn-helix domain-containing protein [Oligella urethralis]SPY08728.1 Transposase and inactivated derivatives [Oligella urethralis]